VLDFPATAVTAEFAVVLVRYFELDTVFLERAPAERISAVGVLVWLA
jgi:hypothetical protein